MATRYVKLTSDEKRALERAVERRFGDTGRISYGAAIRVFCEEHNGDSHE